VAEIHIKGLSPNASLFLKLYGRELRTMIETELAKFLDQVEEESKDPERKNKVKVDYAPDPLNFAVNVEASE
jgi:hypothetical protein